VKQLRPGWLPRQRHTYILVGYVDEAGDFRSDWMDFIDAEENLDLAGPHDRTHARFLGRGGTEKVVQLEWLTPAKARETFIGHNSVDHDLFVGAIIVWYGTNSRE
jgi:hypothetical protein